MIRDALKVLICMLPGVLIGFGLGIAKEVRFQAEQDAANAAALQKAAESLKSAKQTIETERAMMIRTAMESTALRDRLERTQDALGRATAHIAAMKKQRLEEDADLSKRIARIKEEQERQKLNDEDHK